MRAMSIARVNATARVATIASLVMPFILIFEEREGGGHNIYWDVRVRLRVGLVLEGKCRVPLKMNAVWLRILGFCLLIVAL